MLLVECHILVFLRFFASSEIDHIRRRLNNALYEIDTRRQGSWMFRYEYVVTLLCSMSSKGYQNHDYGPKSDYGQILSRIIFVECEVWSFSRRSILWLSWHSRTTACHGCKHAFYIASDHPLSRQHLIISSVSILQELCASA